MIKVFLKIAHLPGVYERRQLSSVSENLRLSDYSKKCGVGLSFSSPENPTPGGEGPWCQYHQTPIGYEYSRSPLILLTWDHWFRARRAEQSIRNYVCLRFGRWFRDGVDDVRHRWCPGLCDRMHASSLCLSSRSRLTRDDCPSSRTSQWVFRFRTSRRTTCTLCLRVIIYGALAQCASRFTRNSSIKLTLLLYECIHSSG